MRWPRSGSPATPIPSARSTPIPVWSWRGAAACAEIAIAHLGRLAAVLRPIKAEIPGFAELGLPGDLLSSWMMKPSGLVLVTGPTGSGKSTTLAACLQWLNENMARHVVTIEDP